MSQKTKNNNKKIKTLPPATKKTKKPQTTEQTEPSPRPSARSIPAPPPAPRPSPHQPQYLYRAFYTEEEGARAWFQLRLSLHRPRRPNNYSSPSSPSQGPARPGLAQQHRLKQRQSTALEASRPLARMRTVPRAILVRLRCTAATTCLSRCARPAGTQPGREPAGFSPFSLSRPRRVLKITAL